MGIQSLQEFVDNAGKYSMQFTAYLEKTSRKTSNLLLVHADSCLRHFYHENIDWVCGGQWSELLQCVEKFVRAFRQSDIELVIFFDGSLNCKSINQWATKHEVVREAVRDTLSLVIHNKNIPFRSKTRNFVPPGSLRAALRLAFRACDVLVCSSIEDIFKETTLYSIDQNCIGIVGHDSNFFFYKIPGYISIGSTRWLKKILSACSVYNTKAILNDLSLQKDDLPYLAALAGNYMLTDSSLSSFFWDLIDEDNPLTKVKENLSSDKVLPPGDMRLKCVAKFIDEKRDEIKDTEVLAKMVFKNSTKITVEEGKAKLEEILSYYKDALKAAHAKMISSKEDMELQEWLPSGFPTYNLQDLSGQPQRYKKDWTFVDKTKQTSTSSKQRNSEKKYEESKNTNLDDPEKVLKEGTLEEAAQALEQLERKESEAELNIPKLDVPEQSESKEIEDVNEQGNIVSDEKPGTSETETPKTNQDPPCSNFLDEFDESDSNEEFDYPREIEVSPVLPTIEPDVLNIARKRHQSGQMCPEVLNLLTQGQLVINMTLDDEMVKNRQPIPLIYRPLRQLMYGVLFGAKSPADEISFEAKKSASENENHVTTKDAVDQTSSVQPPVENQSTVNNNREESNKQELGDDEKKSTDEAIDDFVLVPLVNVVEEKSEDITCSEKSEYITTTCSEMLVNGEDEKKDEDMTFKVKEWCVYGERKLDQPDYVMPKGMSWGVPPLKKLWFGTDSEDNANRLKAFLSCMKSDTVNMSNTAMVPQRLMLLCCVLRYLIQQDSKNSVLTKQDIDAFLAQALSPHLTTEHNTQNLANLKLNQVDARCVQLAAIFMSGIENAIIANDACGSPVPWEFCCPWNFFDGKLFHSKWLQATMNFNAVDMCDGKPHIAEKLERLRWCVTEGLDSKYNITGLEQTKKFFSPFGAPVTMQPRPLYGVMRPAGAHPMSTRGRSRGPTSKRVVHGSGGTLHVAGVPVAHWGGNKSGFGYSKNAPTVLVGGPNSVDLPSDHKRRGTGNRNNRKGYVNQGRGLLETPYVSPWQQGYGYEDVQNTNFQRYMKGVQKLENVRSNIRKLQAPQQHQQQPQHQQQQVFNSRSRFLQQPQQPQQQQQPQPLQQQHRHGNYSQQRPESYTKNTWLGKGRGQQQLTNSFLPHGSISSTSSNNQQRPTSVGGRGQSTGGRGQWMNSIE